MSILDQSEATGLLATTGITEWSEQTAAEPQVLMLPDPVREAVLAWALPDETDSPE